jgi:hypothetical protein
MLEAVAEDIRLALALVVLEEAALEAQEPMRLLLAQQIPEVEAVAVATQARLVETVVQAAPVS